MSSLSKSSSSTAENNYSHRNILLLFDETISIESIDSRGIILMIILIISYICSLLWAFKKDKEKKSFAPHLDGKDLQNPPTVDNIQPIDLDYTAETLDMTSVTTEEMRQYSNTFDGQPNSSPNGTPTGAVDRTRSFRFEGNVQNSIVSTPIRSRGEEIQTPEDSIFRSTKRESQQKTQNDRVTLGIKRSIRSKFFQLIWQRQILLSTWARASRISPRWKRITLLFFLIVADLFVTTWGFIDHSIDLHPIESVLISLSLSWLSFALFSRISSVSKEKLRYAISTREFHTALYSIEREAKTKSICLHSITAIFSIFAFLQYGLFLSKFPSEMMAWLGTSVCIFILQNIIFEFIWLLILAWIYKKTYQSRFFRRVYRVLNKVRFWKI
jgi:hypothetical protein